MSNIQPSNACPSYFRYQCLGARVGGNRSYSQAGYELYRHAFDLGEGEDGWAEAIDALTVLLANDAPTETIVAWATRYLPRCLSLVPPRRYDSFVSGMRRRHVDENE